MCADCMRPGSQHRSTCVKVRDPRTGRVKMPAGVIVAAVVNFVCCGIIAFFVVGLAANVAKGDRMFLGIIGGAGEGSVLAAAVALAVIGTGLVAMAFAGGIGLLKLRGWGRKTTMLFLVLSLLFVTTVWLGFWIDLHDDSIYWTGFANTASDKHLVGHMLGYLIPALAWRAAYVIYLTRPKVKARFGKRPAEPLEAMA